MRGRRAPRGDDLHRRRGPRPPRCEIRAVVDWIRKNQCPDLPGLGDKRSGAAQWLPRASPGGQGGGAAALQGRRAHLHRVRATRRTTSSHQLDAAIAGTDLASSDPHTPRRDDGGGPGAGQAGLQQRPSTRCASWSRPTPRARASTYRTSAPTSSTSICLGTRPDGAAQRPHRPEAPAARRGSVPLLRLHPAPRGSGPRGAGREDRASSRSSSARSPTSSSGGSPARSTGGFFERRPRRAARHPHDAPRRGVDAAEGFGVTRSRGHVLVQQPDRGSAGQRDGHLHRLP